MPPPNSNNLLPETFFNEFQQLISMSEPTYSTSDWSAWHDFMPGSPPTLHIKGKIIFPTPGYSAVLVPRVPQGINPTIYLFDLVVTKPSDSSGDERGHFEEEVGYSEDTSEHYTDVKIYPEEISVPVKPVH
jgi:hypothetical protein